ncbi:MAG: DUF3854 domain-containing protein [Saprospiraceae bacterium]|nr:DUF3854 domain-containing protein [Saprospiraceae bacterium]
MIDPSIVQKIKDCTKIEDIITDFVNLKKSGASLNGDCPFCRQAKKFIVTPSKQIYKCFKCGKGGNSAIQFLIDYKKLSYPDALRYCADKKGILVEDMKNSQTDLPDAPSFREQQLRQSGIGEERQQCQLEDGTVINRYESAQIGKGWTMVPGDDLLLNYVDLDGQSSTYLHPETHKPVPFKRIRFKYPEQHKDKSGNPVKYLQPPKSGSHLWIPELARKAFRDSIEIETLFVTEGEKKADKLCIHGMVALGIMGIHNLSLDEKMSDEFKLFVQKCMVKQVVFLLDADWRDISNKEDKPADERPNTFFAAVKKFRDYFIHYNKMGIQLDIYLACLKKNANQDKGVDDLLVNSLKGSEDKLLKDFEMAKMDRQGKGEYLECHNITTMSEFKLKDLWLLNDVKQFAEFHKTVLSKREKFRFDKKQWAMDADGGVSINNPLLPEEQYWLIEETTDRSGNLKKRYHFDYQNIRIFLKNRGFGRLALSNGNYRFVMVDSKVVKEVNHVYINNFVTDFTEAIDEVEALRMLLRGGTQYLGPDKLEKLYELKLEFIQPEPNCQYLFFKNCFWRVTADGIMQGRLDDLPNHIWIEQLIDFEPILAQTPILDISMEGNKFMVKTSNEAENCHFLKFIERTSLFGWKEHFELVEKENGVKEWEQVTKFILTGKAQDEFVTHFVAKVIALGYLLHQYPNKSEARAIVCMDGLETEVGASEGGTGKSIFGKSLERLVKVATLDGKKHNLTEDNFIYEEVDERTKVIFFDDCRANLDFEFFFGQITTGITVNGKGVKRYTLPAPKFLFTTNHAINGEGNSFKRRQFMLSFSDWYNEFRTPKDDFGCILFDDDWDQAQLNLFHNFMACCIQTYLRFGLRYSTPSDGLEKRKLRQQIGDNLLDWATTYFDPTGNRNKRVNKKLAYDDFTENYPNEKKYCHARQFKKKLRLFCIYAGLQFNPNGQGGAGMDIKSNGREYFVLADENFDANACETVDG